MSLTPLLAAPVVIQIHALSAIAATGLGAVVLFARKGTPAHKLIGRIWVLLMLTVATSALFINEIRMIGPGQLDDARREVWIVHGHHQRPGPAKIKMPDQFNIAGIAKMDCTALQPVPRHLVCIGVNGEIGHAVTLQHTTDQPANAAIADQHHTPGFRGGGNIMRSSMQAAGFVGTAEAG